jgi:protein gp37
MIFVCSMSDLFHEAVPIEFIRRVFATMEAAPQHTFQVLTKRPCRLAEVGVFLPRLPNVWIGVSIESQQQAWRSTRLRHIDSALRFLSIEPLLGPINDLPLYGVEWVIVGGESGPRARPMREEWVLPIRDWCVKAHIPFFFKQWGGTDKKRSGRLLEGRVWDEMPELH